MNCAWCNPSNGGTDGICDTCMLLHFNVDPVTIHFSELNAIPSYVERFRDGREEWATTEDREAAQV